MDLDFLIAGNDNLSIVSFNLEKISELYPASKIYLYDWGYRNQYIEDFQRKNKNLFRIEWKKANITNYMYNKVLCIKDYFDSGHTNKLVYIDTDIIVIREFDEVFSHNFDIGAIWRPDYSIHYGTESWLNAGTIFFNNTNIESTKVFIELWKKRCDSWNSKKWWLDQVELIRLFDESSSNFRDEANRSSILNYENKQIYLRTFSWYNYNHYPYVTYRLGKNKNKIKILHLKSNRKTLFSQIPKIIRRSWVYSFNNRVKLYTYKFLLRFVAIFRSILKKLYVAIIEKKHGRDSEIFYWLYTKKVKDGLCDFVYFRANEILKIFYEINNQVEIHMGNNVLEIGTGPGGGVLDLIEAKELWAIEPEYSNYKKNNIWVAKTKNINVIETYAEVMEKIPDGYFSTIIAINSIDHGDNIGKVISKVYDKLINGGYFLLHVHCRTKEQVNKLHCQSFDEIKLTKMLQNYGFILENYKIYEEDPLSSTYKTFIGILKKK